VTLVPLRSGGRSASAPLDVRHGVLPASRRGESPRRILPVGEPAGRTVGQCYDPLSLPGVVQIRESAALRGGLLIWHVDSAQMRPFFPRIRWTAGRFTPRSRASERDTRGNLDATRTPRAPGRADGVLRPRRRGRCLSWHDRQRGVHSHQRPAAVRNSDGLAAGLVLDQITQLVPKGRCRFHLAIPFGWCAPLIRRR